MGRCGWNAVAEMGELRLCCKKLEYGSTVDNSFPSRLNTLTLWFDVPLFTRVSSCLHPEIQWPRCHLHCKYREMLVCTRRTKRASGCLERVQWLVHSDVPDLDFAVAAGSEKFPLTASLHVDALDPLPI